MKKITLLIILFTSVFTFSQDKYPNMSEANKQLMEKLINEEEARKERVAAYLENNPDFNKKLEKAENKHLYFYDVILGKPIYRVNYNANAARSTRTNELHQGGSLGLNLQGSNMTIGVWDGGPVQDTHPEFQNSEGTASRVQNIDNIVLDGDNNFSTHATHVTGTIAAKGIDMESKGMAPDSNIISYNWGNDLVEMLSAATSINPIQLSNHSYGPGYQDSWFLGAYTGLEENIDALHRNNPGYLAVYACGNDAEQISQNNNLFSGLDHLIGESIAKNNLAVASANPTIEPFGDEIQSLPISSFSSRGPTDDLRVKPDIAGDGHGVYSTIPTDSYGVQNGTSMAAPNVTGSLALLQEYYHSLNGNFMLAATLKGLVCHTAYDDAVVGPDPIFGWGLLDTRASAELILDDTFGESIIRELTLDNNATYTTTFSAQSGDKLIATICWTDMPGTSVPNGTLNSLTPQLVNDLDIRLTKDGVTYFPWRLDFDPTTGVSNSKGDNIRDNVEKIEIDAPTSGTYTLTVTHKGTLLGGAGPFDPASQNFSLVVSGNNITLNTSENQLSQINVYPNPTSDVVYFEGLTFEFNYNIYDIQGKLLSRGKIDAGSNQISLSNLARGVYFVNIFNDNSSLTKKIIKK